MVSVPFLRMLKLFDSSKSFNIDYSKIKVAATETESVKIQSVNLEEIATAQVDCPDVLSHRKGQHPTSLAFEDVEVDGVSLFCEVSGHQARPLLPLKFRQYVINS